MGNQKPQFEPLNMHIFFFIHPKFKNAKLEEKKKQTQHNKHNNKHNNPAMADSCDQFEPNKWRPTVCAKCFAKESLHVKAGGGGGRGGGGGASSGGPPPRKHRPQYAATSSQQPTTPPPRSEPQQQQTPPTPPPKVSPKSSSSRGSSSNKSSPGHRRTGSRGAVPTTPLPSTPPVANQPTTPPKITSSSYPKSESKKKSTRPASSCVEPTMSLSSKERKKKGGSRIETSGDDLQIDLGDGLMNFGGERKKANTTSFKDKVGRQHVNRLFGDKTKKSSGVEEKKTTSDVKVSRRTSLGRVDESKWAKSPDDWTSLQMQLVQGGTTCLMIQDELLWIMTQSDLLSQKTSKSIWELVTSDGQKRSTTKGQSFSKGDFETYNWNNMRRLKSIVAAGQKLLDCQQTVYSVVVIQSRVRGHLARKRYTKMKQLYLREPLKQRNAYFRELMQKEEAYNYDLEVIVRQFLQPARDLAKKPHFRGKGILPADVSAIFANIEDIQKVHNDLHAEFKKVEENWPDLSGLGDRFLRFMNRFKCYEKYVNNFQFAIEVLGNCMEKHESFAQMCLESSERVDLDLQGLISSPLNQMNTYELMFERILENTPSSLLPKEMKALEQCLSAVKQTNVFILSALADSENAAKISAVEKKITRKMKEKLNQRGRVYVDAFSIEFCDRSLPNKRYGGEIVLFSDSVFLAKFASKRDPSALQSKGLFSFETTNVNTPDDLKKLHGFELEVGEGSKKFAVTMGSSTDYHIVVPQLKELVSKNQKNRVFEVKLSQVLENEGNPSPPIPSVVRLLIGYLDKHALESQGLFRVAGSQSETTDLKDKIDKGQPVDFGSGVSGVHSVASVLKLYFRLLPEPLLTFDVYDPLIRASEECGPDKERLKKEISTLLAGIPYHNRMLIKYLVEFLARVAAKSEINKMLPSNLAICFAPNLLRPKVDSISAALDVMKVNGIVEQLIIDSSLVPTSQ